MITQLQELLDYEWQLHMVSIPLSDHDLAML